MRREFLQCRKQAIHFFGGVVVDQADAQEAAFLFDAETFGEIERVVVAVPGEDAAVAEKCSRFRWACDRRGGRKSSSSAR